MQKPVLLCAAAVLFGATSASLFGATSVYTDKVAWATALSGVFPTEDFNDGDLNIGVSFVSEESGHINPAGGYYQDVLMSASQNDPMTIWSFSPEITAYGGNWTLGGPGGSGNSLLVYISGVPMAVGAISNSYNGGFWGFISDTPFTSVVLIGGGGSHQQNYRLDDMVYCPFPRPVVPGDLNGDGTVGSRDLDIVRANWRIAVPPGDLISGDASGDGAVGSADLDTVRACWGSLPTAVPEPSFLVLGLLSAWMLLGRRGRR